MYSRYILLSALLVIGAETYAKNNKTEVVSLSSSYNNSVENNSVDSSTQDSIFKDKTLQEVKVVARKSGTSRLAGAVNGIAVNKDELFKAACCNLGESFTTNPSVDVAYNDATTGARQIKLLGLSGTYVQMLTENLPNFRGAAIPYALGYVPGPWMKGIQVSKGSASVKNGYESITGQINVDYLKPEDEQQVEVTSLAIPRAESRQMPMPMFICRISGQRRYCCIMRISSKTMMIMAMVSMICQAENNIMYRTVGCIKASTTSFMVDLGL